jgi:hypothetical protein
MLLKSLFQRLEERYPRQSWIVVKPVPSLCGVYEFTFHTTQYLQARGSSQVVSGRKRSRGCEILPGRTYRAGSVSPCKRAGLCLVDVFYELTKSGVGLRVELRSGCQTAHLKTQKRR